MSPLIQKSGYPVMPWKYITKYIPCWKDVKIVIPRRRLRGQKQCYAYFSEVQLLAFDYVYPLDFNR